MDRPLSSESVNERRNRLIKRFALFIIFVVGGLYGLQSFFSPEVDLTDIRTAKVRMGTIKAAISAGGIVVPMNEETISSEIETQIVKLLAKPGQTLNIGDPIMQLDTLNILLAIENLKEQIALKDNKIQAKHLNLTKTINDIQSRVELLKVDIESRESLESRLSLLHSQGVTSAQDLLKAQFDVKRSRIEAKQLKQSILDIKSTTDSEIAGLELEKSILNKELQEQHRLRTAATVIATRNGVLSWLKDEEGSSVAAREPLAKIADVSQFRIEATLSDFYASQLVSGMSVEVGYRNNKISGTLETLTPTIENGVMKLMIELNEPNAAFLHNNLRVDVELVTDVVENTYTLTKGPFINGRGIQQVFVIRDDTAYSTEVTVGASNADSYEIVEGLKEGEEIIISDVSDFVHLNEFKINSGN